MKYLILTPFLLVAISSCNSSGNPDNSEMQSDPVTTGDDPELVFTPETEPEDSPGSDPEQAQEVITTDTHVDIVANVLAIYSGSLYGDDIFAAPGYSGVAIDEWPQINPDTAELITQPAQIVCSNGGTANITPETQGYFSDNLLTWNFVFENCQDGIALLDGSLSRAIYEAITMTSTGFVREEQTRVVRYSGSLTGRSGNGHYWITNGMDFGVEDGGVSLIIEDSTTEFFPDGISGEFTVKADWTGNRPISVRIPGSLTPASDAGELMISHGADNTLVLDADTGDITTVDITITENGTTRSFTQPWALWSDSLMFDSVSGY